MSKIAFLYSGQGTQYPGMMKDIYEKYDSAKKIFDRADETLGYKLSEIIFDGDVERLNQTKYTQPALVTCEYAILQVLREMGIEEECVEGFSLGEWTALASTDVITFEETLSVVSCRAEYMQNAVPLGEGGMAVVLKKTEQEVEELCERVGGIYPANYNCTGQITVAGTSDGIERLMTIAQEESIVVIKLDISVPSHCVLMRPAAEKLEKRIASLRFHDSVKPIYMNCSAKPETNGEIIKENMVKQLMNPVCFEKSILAMIELGVDVFVEIGPGKTLSGIIKKIVKKIEKKVEIYQTGDAETLTQTIDILLKR